MMNSLKSLTYFKKSITKGVFNFGKMNQILNKNNLTEKNFSTMTQTNQNTLQTPKKSHGGLRDQDRIFTNVYRDGDPFIEGALKRVNYNLTN